MNRIFIVGPSEHGMDVGDTLYIVCRTKSKYSLWDIYQSDLYEEVSRVGSLGRALGIAKRLGAKRPTVI